jgi:sortase A
VVVEPDALWVLDPSPNAALTLITCYPFDFVGPAPRRFVVHAERVVETNEPPEAETIGAGTQ